MRRFKQLLRSIPSSHSVRLVSANLAISIYLTDYSFVTSMKLSRILRRFFLELILEVLLYVFLVMENMCRSPVMSLRLQAK